MNREKYQRVKDIFQSALDVAPEERAAHLDRVCAGDEALRREVERLLESFDSQYLERPAVAQIAEIVVKEKLENEPTKISLNEETAEIDEKPPDAPDENALRPSRWRFALICLLFVNMFVFAGINIYQAFLVQSFPPFVAAPHRDGIVIVDVRQGFEGEFRVGDELVSINGIETNSANVRRLEALGLEPPGERRTVIARRDGETRRIETVSVPPPLSFRFNRVLYDVLLRAIFLITGLVIFLFKPNDKHALLLTLIFVSSLASGSLTVLVDLPLPLFVVKAAGLLIIIFCAPVFLHFCLVFPERSLLLRRFPKLEYLIYLPSLLITLPTRLLLILQLAGNPVLTDLWAITLLQSVGRYTYDLHFLAGITALIFTYRRSGESARRQLRVSVVGLLCSMSPFLLNGLLLNPLLRVFEIRNPWQEWMPFIVSAPLLLTPPVSAYAIVRDQVIPFSFVIRRGLQYLLAKNALRLLLVLPILGIILNIAASRNLTLGEILFDNSLSFYSFIALAGGVFLLMRFRLNEWIDRRFFREQYNQEKILRELTEAVKESDSLPKLSRLVGSKVRFALHPENVYLFFRDDALNSGFTLSYTTNETPEPTTVADDLTIEYHNTNLNTHRDFPRSPAADYDKKQLATESPLLRFMQQTRGAVEFPTRQTDDLPNREQRWLREINASLLVPMHGTDGRLAGIFSLGEKMSHVPYTRRDKELLETLANQIALVHENLGLKDLVRREQRIKTEVLSRFDQADINLLKECPTCGRCFDRATLKCGDDNSNLTFTLPVERTVENRYRLEKLLGKGGMGAVYRATDTRINRPVAVKILSGAMFGNRAALRRFEREAQTAGKLNHRNIVTVFDYGVLSTEGAFLVMELVAGETLSEVLKREEKLDLGIVVAWFAQILDGLEAAHKAGIVHRDLKPDNIFVTRNEDETVRLCILDFGLARFNDYEFSDSVTAPGTVMGTLGYMPPEQLRGEKTDERSDLFAAGVMIYESLHGEKPFAGGTYQQLVRSMSEELVFDTGEPCAEFFERSLAQKAAGRYASASEMKENLLNLCSIPETN